MRFHSGVVTALFSVMLHTCLAMQSFRMPAEDCQHAGTLMTWPTKHSVYGESINGTRSEIAAIANAVSRHEPLIMFVRSDSDNILSARKLLGDNKEVTIIPTTDVDSLWSRDTGPVFVYHAANKGNQSVSGVVMNFNEWGRKLPPTSDDQLASTALKALKLPSTVASFTAEGGGFEVDGEGTMLATESAILNRNRNPDKSKADVEAEFSRLFGIRKFLWVKGVKDHDITDDHIDATARFIGDGLVLLSRPPKGPSPFYRAFEQTRDYLATSTDAEGRKIKLIEIDEGDYSRFPKNMELTLSYVNYYLVNGAILIPQFGDALRDAEAARVLGQLHPGRKVEKIHLRQLARQGGGIHCATQQLIHGVEVPKERWEKGDFPIRDVKSETGLIY